MGFVGSGAPHYSLVEMVRVGASLRVLMVGPVEPGDGGATAGGVATTVSTLSRYLMLAGHDVLVFADNVRTATETPPHIFQYPANRRLYAGVGGLSGLPGLVPRGVPLRHIVKLLPYVGALKNVMRKFTPDVIHVHHAYARPALAYAACRGTIPIVTTIHSYHALLGLSPGLERKLKARIRTNLSLSSRIIAVSNFIRNQTLEYVEDGSKVITIPNGVPMDLLEWRTKNLASESRSQGPLRVLFVGNLIARKGVDVLVRAFSHVAKIPGQPRPKLIIVGDGPARDSLENLTTRLDLGDQVEFVGYRRGGELYKFYADADIFVSVPWAEAQGIVFLEAMASALPVIGTDVGGIPDMVKNGVNGFLVKPGDVDSLVAKLLELLRNERLRRTMGLEGQRMVVRNFLWDALASKTVEVYESAVDQKAMTFY